MENNDTLEVIQRIPLDKLRPYPDHPFGVRDELRDLTVHKANSEELRDPEEREKRKEKAHGRE